jgi:hypothetical protein
MLQVTKESTHQRCFYLTFQNILKWHVGDGTPENGKSGCAHSQRTPTGSIKAASKDQRWNLAFADRGDSENYQPRYVPAKEKAT